VLTGFNRFETMHVWDLFHIQWHFSPSGSMELEIKNENEMKNLPGETEENHHKPQDSR
jgi:hypothetical protein